MSAAGVLPLALHALLGVNMICSYRPLRAAGWLIVCVLLTARPAWAETFTFHHENVLGTSLEIQVDAESASIAAQAEASVLREIQRLSGVFSSYDATSEFSRWQQAVGVPTKLSPELIEVLAKSDHWQAASKGAFNPAIEAVSRIWKQAADSQIPPSPEQLNSAVRQMQARHWKLDVAAGEATRLTDCRLNLNSIAKGAIVDRVCETALKNVASLHGLMVAIGGDLHVHGDTVRQVGITDPFNDAINAEPISTIFVSNQAVGGSGNYRRGFRVGDRWYSHIIDPRTGRPVEEVVGASVVAPTTRDASALATMFSVMPLADSIALAEMLPDVECLLITAQGRQVRSSGWHELEQPRLRRFAAAGELLALADDKPAASSAKTPTLLDLVVNFELSQPDGAQYRRPYVAVWLEDKDEFPVRTAVLWMTTKQPGPRWHRDLLRWYRNDGIRRMADGTNLIGTISGATRGPGQYKAVFNGLDDAGEPLPAGNYTLMIEVAREHGTYQLIRQKLTLGSEPIAETKLKRNVEIESASYEYRAHKTAATTEPVRQ